MDENYYYDKHIYSDFLQEFQILLIDIIEDKRFFRISFCETPYRKVLFLQGLETGSLSFYQIMTNFIFLEFEISV